MHTEAARSAETNRRRAASRVHDQAWRLVRNVRRIGRRQHLLFISERSRLPVVISIREAKQLGTVFPDAVCERLAIVGVAAGDIADERMRMSKWASAGPGIAACLAR